MEVFQILRYRLTFIWSPWQVEGIHRQEKKAKIQGNLSTGKSQNHMNDKTKT